MCFFCQASVPERVWFSSQHWLNHSLTLTPLPYSQSYSYLFTWTSCSIHPDRNILCACGTWVWFKGTSGLCQSFSSLSSCLATYPPYLLKANANKKITSMDANPIHMHHWRRFRRSRQRLQKNSWTRPGVRNPFFNFASESICFEYIQALLTLP